MLSPDFWAQALWETLYMVAVSTVVSYAIGLPVGLLLVEMCIRDRPGPVRVYRPLPVPGGRVPQRVRPAGYRALSGRRGRHGGDQPVSAVARHGNIDFSAVSQYTKSVV